MTYAIRYRDTRSHGWTRLINAGNKGAALYQFLEESKGLPITIVAIEEIK